MTDMVTLKKQIGMQATRLGECIRKINQLTSDLHHSQQEVERLRAKVEEIRIGQFVIRRAGDRVWIGRSGGEGGEFATANVEAALAQFYHANF
jgi:hypothetical protein